MLICIGILLALAALFIALFFDIRSIGALGEIVNRLRKGDNVFSALYQVDEESTKHGGLLVAEVLKAHGVQRIFTLVGGHISPILVGCEQAGMGVIDVRHEVTAVFAADATARLTQTVGVAAVTAGPGLTNTVTAVKNAQMAESPVLLMGGAAATLLKGRGALQDIDQMALFRPLCKYCATVTRVRDIVPILRAALHAAMSGTPGPVFVEFPINTLYQYALVHRELGLNPNPRGFVQKAMNSYLQWNTSRMFGRAWVEQTVAPLPVEIPLATDNQVGSVAALLAAAKRPLFLMGSQVVLPPVKVEVLRSTVESLGVPCYLGGMARGLLGAGAKLHMRQCRRDALKEADLVVMLGAVCDFRLGYGRVLGKKCPIVAVNRDKVQLFKNAGVFWNPTVAVQADAASFLVSLQEKMKVIHKTWNGASEEWLGTLRQRDNVKEEKNREKSLQTPAEYLNPVAVCMELEKHLPPNTILVADGGDFVATAAYTIHARGPLRWLDPGAFGTLGVGAGFALGAKLACPDTPVVIIFGDGSLGYSLIEFDTFDRHKVPVTAIVGNDGCWTQIAREQVPLFKSEVACKLLRSPYEKAMTAFNGWGEAVYDLWQVEKVLSAALQRNADGQSALVNVMIGKSDFREGSISV